MKLSPRIIAEEHSFLFNGDDKNQKVTITFEFFNNEGLKNTGEWRFKHVSFTPQSCSYSLSDWEFLAAINEKIKEISKKLIK